MADHSQNVHNCAVFLDLTEDYEFIITSRFQKPMHRQVVKFLNITRVEQEGKTKLTAGQKSWGS